MLRGGLHAMKAGQLAGLVAQLEEFTAANALRVEAETRWQKLRAGAEAALRVRRWEPATQLRKAVAAAHRVPGGAMVLVQRLAEHARALATRPAPELAERAWQAMIRRAEATAAVRGAPAGSGPGVAASAGPGRADEGVGRRIVAFVAEGYGIDPGGLSDESLLDQTLGRVVDELLRQSEQAARHLRPEDERAVLAELTRSLSEMSEEQRRQVAQALRLDRVSGEVLWRLFRTGVLGVAVMQGLHAAGFGVFLAATTVTHAIFTTLLGITLPFGVYTALTTTLGWLMGPVGWMLVGGVAWWQVQRQERQLARWVLGLALVQIAMHALERGAQRREGP